MATPAPSIAESIELDAYETSSATTAPYEDTPTVSHVNHEVNSGPENVHEDSTGPSTQSFVARSKAVIGRMSPAAWCGVFIATVALAFTIYYGARQLRVAETELSLEVWQSSNEYRESCREEQVRVPLSVHTSVENVAEAETVAKYIPDSTMPRYSVVANGRPAILEPSSLHERVYAASIPIATIDL